MPRGGRRPGAGRKPKGPKLVAAIVKHPSVPTTNTSSPIEEFDAPNSLTLEERQVWLLQAPHAFRARTLVRASALSFERYCRLVVQERNESKSSGAGGANHRGLMKQINQLELQFQLVPNGRPMAEPVPTPMEDDDEAFFGRGA